MNATILNNDKIKKNNQIFKEFKKTQKNYDMGIEENCSQIQGQNSLDHGNPTFPLHRKAAELGTSNRSHKKMEALVSKVSTYFPNKREKYQILILRNGCTLYNELSSSFVLIFRPAKKLHHLQ